jgi:hypothetical protein
MTDFKVSSTTVVPDKNQVVLQGEIANGTVKAGMKVQVSGLSTEISGVSMNFKGGRFEVGVILQFPTKDDLAAWGRMNVAAGQVLRLDDATSS